MEKSESKSQIKIKFSGSGLSVFVCVPEFETIFNTEKLFTFAFLNFDKVSGGDFRQFVTKPKLISYFSTPPSVRDKMDWMSGVNSQSLFRNVFRLAFPKSYINGFEIVFDDSSRIISNQNRINLGFLMDKNVITGKSFESRGIFTKGMIKDSLIPVVESAIKGMVQSFK